MSPTPANGQVVLACRDLAAAEAFFRDLGFRLRTVFPADAPRELGLDGFGVRLCLRRSEHDDGGHLRLAGAPARTLTAPNGARIEFVGVDGNVEGAEVVEVAEPVELAAPPEDVAPRERVGSARVENTERAERDAARVEHAAADLHEVDAVRFALPERVVIHRAAANGWHEGRAGMQYRDLLPGRLGGAVVASHIRIERGGPVADYVHFHRVAAQALYVAAGEVRVVYEDQGDPFVLRAGDCVLQPPTIRHRVLDCSDGLEVIEVASPAEHVTFVADENVVENVLPNGRHDAARRWHGQRFHHHRAAGAAVGLADGAAREPGFRARDCGIGAASGGAIGVRVLSRDPRAPLAAAPANDTHETLRLWFVRRGELTIAGEALAANDLAVLPPGAPAALTAASPDAELVEFVLALPR